MFLLPKYHFLVASWVSMASGSIQKRSSDHRLAGGYRCQGNSEVPWPSDVFAQILARLRQDDYLYLSFNEKERELGMEYRLLVTFKGIKQRSIRSPVLAIADQDRLFHVVCDASDFWNRLCNNIILFRQCKTFHLVSATPAVTSRTQLPRP